MSLQKRDHFILETGSKKHDVSDLIDNRFVRFTIGSLCLRSNASKQALFVH